MEMKELIEKFSKGCREITGHDPKYEDGVYECGVFSLDTKSKKLSVVVEENIKSIVKKGDKFKVESFAGEYGWLELSLDTDLINDVKVGEYTWHDKRYKVFVFETDIGTLRETVGGIAIDL